GAHLAVTGASGAGLGTVARLRARTGAAVAGDLGGDFDFGGTAVIGLFQGDGEIVAQILAAILALASRHAAHHLAENILEHIAEAGEVAKPGAGARSPHPGLKRGMAETVVSRALLIVLQDVIGLAD